MAKALRFSMKSGKHSTRTLILMELFPFLPVLLFMFSCNKDCKLGGFITPYIETHELLCCLQWSSVCCLCPSPLPFLFKADKPEMNSLHTEQRNQKACGLVQKYSHSISKWMCPTLEVESPFFLNILQLIADFSKLMAWVAIDIMSPPMLNHRHLLSCHDFSWA